MLLPWAEGPFDLLLHGELHYRAGGDFDRRMALISFDNAIEVSISTYLGLDPILRNGKHYERKSVEQWKTTFHTKLDFLQAECAERQVEMHIQRTHFVWYHAQRSDQYHEGKAATPTRLVLDGVRRAGLWVFEFLFDIPKIEAVLDQRILALSSPTQLVQRDPEMDQLINDYCGEITIGDFTYTASELLHSHDAEAYRALGLELQTFVIPEETA